MEEKTLLYNCCDDEYTHFIPIHCAAALFSNKNIDLEIGINLHSLTSDEENALSLLREMHQESNLNIKYCFYDKIKPRGFDNVVYNGQKMWSNTVRFVSEPEIKDTYTYIGDIDIIMLESEFYKYHIDIMEKYNTSYSNWVRDNDASKLSGLHFVKTDCFYPQNLEGIRLTRCDENILKDIQSRVCEINYEIPRRPVHGLHFSKNQRLPAQLKLCKKFINELNSYKDKFKQFLESDEYNAVKKCNTNLINNYINEFIIYYNTLKIYEKERVNSNF